MTMADQDERRAEEFRAAAEHEPDPEERVRAAAERRADTAQSLESQGIDREVVATRLRADVSQGKPATEAVKGAGKAKAPKALKTRGHSTQIQRSGLGR